MMLDIQNISLSLGGRRILQHVSLQAKAGELCVVMGANGAGKTTLLKVLAGEYRHYTGQIRLHGEQLQSFSVAEQAQRRAVLSQQVVLQLAFTVREVVQMGRFVHHAAPELDTAIVDYAMDTMQVADLAGRSWVTLSGGQQQRVHMARVLAQLLEKPQLEKSTAGKKMLLLDEPVTGMDIRHQQLALQLAKKLTEYGMLVIAVLHDFQLAAAYADQLIFLHQGGVHVAGSVQEVLTAPHIRHCFGIGVQVLVHPQCNHPIVIPAFAETSNLLYHGNNDLFSPVSMEQLPDSQPESTHP
ncbi:heme ABC transporter ATP-binding protein [Chitinophaga solisilvae]|uniref:heme ABC transporter ATP-binding protein n=1 Tax=Chitinophaga solisilvae TaxID=1233460 RepID=UPI00136DAA82|nr:heme ABC transporter ATP-binding protein [Chitinophaga solisilvae]